MVDVTLLRKRIDESGIPIVHVAKAAGMSRETFYNRLENPIFKVSEAQKIADVLHLSKKDFYDIFFAKSVI